MASLESGRVVTCDWLSARQKQCGYLPFVEAPWWDCAAHPPPFTEFTYPGRARRHLPRNRLWLVERLDMRRESESNPIRHPVSPFLSVRLIQWRVADLRRNLPDLRNDYLICAATVIPKEKNPSNSPDPISRCTSVRRRAPAAMRTSTNSLTLTEPSEYLNRG